MNRKRSVPALLRLRVFLLAFSLLLAAGVHADTTVELYESFAGNINFVGTQKTRRTASNAVNPCAVLAPGANSSAAISGIPSGAIIKKAYLYWAGSGTTGDSSTWDYTVTFEGNTVTAGAGRNHTSEASLTRTFFGGAADVTSIVNAKSGGPNGTYTLSNLTVVTTGDHCSIETVLAGWSLVIIYSHPGEDFRVINLYEGFQNFLNSSITLVPSNFRIPVSPINGKHAHITWEGDDTISDAAEDLVFNGSHLFDTTNPLHQQFNSKSTITSPADTASYGVDFDVYNTSLYLSAGQTSATTVYSSGSDRVLLSAEIISNTNTPVADLGITMGFSGTLGGGQAVTYTLNVVNNGPNDETGPITVTNTPPAGLTYTGASGTGWSCPSPYTTCTRTGTLASGASASPITLTATVASSATGTVINTASVVGQLFDNVAGNNTATDSRTALEADLSIAMVGSTLVPGTNAIYTLTVTNIGPDTHAGTITVSDVLPSGLTFVSASGTGWTCNSGVTCTYSGSLASATAAPTITLTVAVAAGATPPLTNSATVTGTYHDSVSTNNTASHTWKNTTGGCSTSTEGSDTVITCLSNGTLTIPSNVSKVRYLVVGGGGGGGGIVSGNAEGAGGGGAGGVLSSTNFAVTAGATYSMTVGSGGTAGTGTTNGGSGGSSTFATVTASGGGGGAWAGNTVGIEGSNGASGGGGSDDKNGGTGSQGNDGGAGNNNDGGGGGGGAGAAGSNGSNSAGGNGGVGIANDISGVSTYYGGGGGGGTDDDPGTGGTGGSGGGGTAPSSRGAGVAGIANTGGGGSGASGSSNTSGSAYSGGSGGSGIVIIRYPTVGTPTCDTALDQFSTVSYSRPSDGSLIWASNWIETNDNNSAASGYILITNNALRLTGGGATTPASSKPRIEREVNLTGFTSATLTFDYTQSGTKTTDYIEVLISSDGGSNWAILGTINGAGANQAYSYSITSYIASNVRVGFRVTASSTSDRFNFDNVQIEACKPSGPNHLRIEHTGSGVTCSPTTLTVKACADAACSNPYTGTVTGTLAATGTPTVNWVGGASFSIGASGSTTKQVQVTTAGNVTWGTTGESPAPGNATSCYIGATASCTFTSSLAGFIFNVPDHYSDAEQTITVSAVKQSDNSLACTPAFAGVSKTVNFKCGYSNPASGTLPVRMTNNQTTPTTYALNSSNSTAAACDGTGQSLSLAFNANGVATGVKVQYADVGNMSLTASYSGSGTGAGLVMTGSDTFIAAPKDFVFSGITGAPIAAGANFSATITAHNSSGNAVPNFGKETTAESVTLALGSRVAPSGTNDCVNGPCSGSVTGSVTLPWSGGAATASNLTYSEVGTMTLTGTLASGSTPGYLGSGLSATGTSATVGAFVPAYFDTAVTPGCGTFTYSGQPFTVAVTAKRTGGGTTMNYSKLSGCSVCSKDVTLQDPTATAKFNGTNTVAATAFAKGVGTSSTVAYTLTPVTTGPTTITLRAIDSTVTPNVSSSGHTEGTADLRSGRLRLFNAFGTEKADLAMPVQAQYWTGKSWAINNLDSCTSLPANAFNLIGAPAGVTVSGPVSIASGQGSLVLTKPNSATATVDLALNLGATGSGSDTSCLASHGGTPANLPWLRGQNGSTYPDGSPCPATGRDPSARATFGLYSNPEKRKAIHIRETY